MLEIVFRGIIDIRKGTSPTIDQEELVKNLRALQKSKIKYEDDSYRTLYHRVLDHYKQYQELPDINLLTEHFSESEGNEAVMVALEKIKAERPWIGSNYREQLKKVHLVQNEEAFNELLDRSSEIMTSGLTTGTGKQQKKLKGLEDATSYLVNRVRELQQENADIKTESQITSSADVKEEFEEYDKMKTKQTETVGVFTGLMEIDDTCRGLKHTEMMLIAAYVGQLKTTTCLNMCYRAIISGWDSAFFTLEMSRRELKSMMYCLHTCHPKFLTSEYADLVGTVDVNDVLYGDLSERQEAFYKAAIRELESNPLYGRMFMYQPPTTSTTTDDVDLKCREWNSQLMMEDRKLEFVCVDYVTLLAPTELQRTRDPNMTLNNIVKTLKQLCLTFNNGQGLRLVSPFQVNRGGYLEATKNDGLYNGTHLSNANEAERSSDVVIGAFMDDARRESGIVKYCCIKNRRNKFFKPFEASVNFKSRFICDMVSDAQRDFGRPPKPEEI